MIRGVIFDNDGTIIDSNHHIYDCWGGIFKRRFGVILNKEFFGLQLGKSGDDFTQALIDKYQLPTTGKELFREILEHHEKNRMHIKLKKGVRETLKALHGKYKIALATGAPTSMGHWYMDHFNLSAYFDFIIGGDAVPEAKPHPDIFLEAAKGLQLPPEQCVVVEDALMGLKAAKAAGMKCIMVEDEFTKYQDHSAADGKIEEMTELLVLITKLP